MATDKKNSRQELVESIVSSMKNRGEWQKTWTNLASNSAPHNPITGTKYSGVNFLALSLEQTKMNTLDSRWCTFDQAVEAGYKIPKNTKSSHAHFYDLKVTLNKGDKSDLIKAKSGRDYISKVIAHYREQYPNKSNEIKAALSKANELQPSMNSDRAKLALFVGELNKATGADLKLYANTVIKSFPIFNFSQLENVPKLEASPNTNTFEPIKRAEGLLIASGAKIYHDSANSNYYTPEKHEIHLTSRESFKSPEAYYSTALHEVAHWTKGDGLTRHVKVDEKSGNGHDLAYAREELRAELASVFMSSDLNLKLDIQNHSAYLGNYLQILNNDYNEFFSAVSDAQKISNHVLGFEKRLDLESVEAKELQSKNPDLYHKIVEYNVKNLAHENTHIKSDSTYDFKVGDAFIAKTAEGEIRKYQINSISSDSMIIKDLTHDIVQEHNNKSFQALLDASNAEKLDQKSPQLSLKPEYRKIAQEVLKNEFFGLAKENLENTFVFIDSRAAQRFIDKLMTEYDVPGNMINAGNFERNDKTQSFIVSKEPAIREAVAAQDHPNKIYLEKFFAEKNLPLMRFNVNTPSGTHIIESDVVIHYLVNNIDSKTQGTIKNILMELDFKNGNINDFLEHCAGGMVKQYEADHERDAMVTSMDSREFKETELAYELRNEREFHHDASPVKLENTKEKVLKTLNSTVDDNDFSR